MQGGLIFPGPNASYLVFVESEGITFEMKNNNFFMYRPKWWAVRGWISLARTVLAYLPNKTCDQFRGQSAP